MVEQAGLDAKYIKPFLESTSNAFKTMVSINPEMGKPFTKQGAAIKGEAAISVIGIAGKVKGNVSLILRKELAIKIASNFLGATLNSLNADVKDAVGELTNIIVSDAKKHFAEMDESFKIAIPSVLVGDIHDIHSKDSIPSLLLPFSSDEGDFYLKICLVKENSGQST